MKINFPQYPCKIQYKNGKPTIFDIIRKKYVALTPEEWVRQHLLHFMINEKAYPKSLIAVEMSLSVNTLSKRADIVAYNNEGNAIMIIEFKAPEVSLSQSTFDQAARYNLSLQVPYLVISNGSDTICSKIHIEDQSFSILDAFPEYSSL